MTNENCQLAQLGRLMIMGNAFEGRHPPEKQSEAIASGEEDVS
jgi:hypothetical protein